MDKIRNIFEIAGITYKGVFRHRPMAIIISLSLFYLVIPLFSALSIRQVQEVGATFSLALNSFVLILLSIAAVLNTVWKDLENKVVYLFLSHPISRSEYFIGRFIGCEILLLSVSFINLIASCVVIYICSNIYPSDTIVSWKIIIVSFLLCFVKVSLLTSLGYFVVSISTSFFTPFFAMVGIYIIGSAFQSIYDYVINEAREIYPLWFKMAIKVLYYIIPNFGAFDAIPYVVYGIPLSFKYAVLMFIYGLLYISCIISLGAMIFSKKDIS